MPITHAEIKRKLFHNLSVLYIALYAVAPRSVTLTIMGVALIGVWVLDFLRLRRPELNAQMLARFGGIHRTSEILRYSGISWTLLGSWLTMAIFTNKSIVLAALGFQAFGDTAAALGGQRFGRRPWKANPEKTLEGSACFALISAAWGLLFLRPHVAILGALLAAWVESRKARWNDNVAVPVYSGAILSVLNLALGRF